MKPEERHFLLASKKPPENYSWYIKELRLDEELTQQEFAEQLGVTFATINRWENGHFKPSALAWKQIINWALAH